MKTPLLRCLAMLGATVAVGLTPAGSPDAAPSGRFVRPPARQQEATIRIASDGLTVEQAWARASAGQASTGAAYFTVTAGAQPERLVGVSTPIAAVAEVHESFTDNGVTKMRPMPGVPLLPGQSVTLAPGGYHVMLMGLKQPLVAGQSFPLILRFEHAQPITIDVQVRAIGRPAPTAAPTDHMHMQ